MSALGKLQLDRMMDEVRAVAYEIHRRTGQFPSDIGPQSIQTTCDCARGHLIVAATRMPSIEAQSTNHPAVIYRIAYRCSAACGVADSNAGTTVPIG